MAFTTIPFDILGFRVMGDVGGYTCYTDKHYRKTFYKKAPPKEPASPRQRTQRDRFRYAVNAWRALTPAHTAALERAVAKCSLCLTGQNLFVSCSLRADQSGYEAVARQAGESLPPLATIP